MKGIMQATTDARLGFDLFKGTINFQLHFSCEATSMIDSLRIIYGLLDPRSSVENQNAKCRNCLPQKTDARTYRFRFSQGRIKSILHQGQKTPTKLVKNSSLMLPQQVLMTI